MLSQEKENYQLKDTILVVAERYAEENINKQTINLKEFFSNGFVNYDLMNYLKIIGINSFNDFNTLPYMEGADFQEQQFFINYIPVPFQSRLIGLQSGLNSLLFSQISLLETHSLNNFDKPIKLNVKTNKIDTNQIHFTSSINFLHLENAISIPINNLKGGVVIGYNRSLLESIKPFLRSIMNKNDFGYELFPFFQGFQMYADIKTNNVSIKPILIYSEDNGSVGINTKDFKFKSHQLSYGVEIQSKIANLKNSILLYSNLGKNKVDYKFLETKSGDVQGKTNLSFRDVGFNSNTEYVIETDHTLSLSFGYIHQNTTSENKVSFTYNNNDKTASYSSDYFESALYYQSILSNKFLSTIYIGFNSYKFYNIFPSLGIDLIYSDLKLFEARFQTNYKAFQDPINPIFYSFQNTIWDPSFTSSLFFVDNNRLPLKPMHLFNTSFNMRKNLSSSFLETNISIKLFFRRILNLLYANNYPNGVTIYNSDLEFNQDSKGLRYGLSLILENNIKELSIKNLTSITFCRSLNHDNRSGLKFNSLNYSPITVTNLTQFEVNRFYANILLIYNAGRYFFSQKINKYYSSVDSTYYYSMFTDHSSQLSLMPYYRMDISLLYQIIKGNFNLSCGLSIINIFDHKNESNRNYSLDLSKKSLLEKSEYFNLPRFFVFEISYKVKI